MKKQYVLYNPYANNGRGADEAKTLEGIVTDRELIFCDMTQISGYQSFFEQISNCDSIIICGGDGTLNRFVNDTAGLDIGHSVYYYATGSGNDFLHDIGVSKGTEPFCIDKYLKHLPTVHVNDKTSIFINGIGFGIDGYCCEVGDKLRATTTKPINYSAIAIKGLLFHFKPRNATVTVDGAQYTFKKMWIAPTMNGRFYGGGMMMAPAQERFNADGKLSFVAFHGSGKLKTLMIFPSIFKGEHVKHKKHVTIIEGKDITVRFDRPTALQIDGETVLDVTEYRAVSHSIAQAESAQKQTAEV